MARIIKITRIKDQSTKLLKSSSILTIESEPVRVLDLNEVVEDDVFGEKDQEEDRHMKTAGGSMHLYIGLTPTKKRRRAGEHLPDRTKNQETTKPSSSQVKEGKR